VALRLLEEYAPPRSVRLLGVRVAGLATDDARGAIKRADPPTADQLALPV
jgi:hypothetical protein